MVQQVLSSIDGDEINSINDNVESQQVVNIIKRCYANLADKLDYPEKYTLFGLTSSNDTSKPTVMYLPSTVENAQWVKYDSHATGTDTDFQPMKYVGLEEFFTRMHSLVPSEDSSLTSFTVAVGSQNVKFVVRKDKAPQWYTTWDDYTFVFDSYDNTIDSTLQTSKTLCYGKSVLPWSAVDSYVIPIDNHQLLLNSAISWAWAEMKQAQNVKAEREVRDQLVSTERNKHAIGVWDNYKTITPNYGRK